MEWESICPRFTFYYRKQHGSLLWMDKEQWDCLNVNSTGRVAIELESLPISNISNDADVIALTAYKMKTNNEFNNEYKLELFRRDEKDPLPINVDKYKVFGDLHKRKDFPDIVNLASTSITPSLHDFLADHVALVKEEKGDGHWLKDLPKEVELLYNISIS